MDSSSKDSSCNCNWMSIYISIEIVKLPVWSDFPNLRLLMILDRSEFPEGFDADFICFGGIKELNVLNFSGLMYTSFPPSLKLLKKLRTLHLVSCEVEDISLVGELASLEILIVRHCYSIKELPVHVGRLNHLRVLELCMCIRLKRIAPGVISSLVGLEELMIIGCVDKWEPKENQSEERNASLSELESLPSLSCLEIELSDCNLVAEEIHLQQQLVRYQIHSPRYEWMGFGKVEHERSITLTLQGGVTVGNWIRQLLRSTQSLVLTVDGSTMKNVANPTDCKFLELEEIIDGIIPEQSNSFHKLESLISLNENVSLGNLKSLSIVSCPNLRYVLSAATARSLVQLDCLAIRYCDTIEQVLWSDRDASIIELRALKKLMLTLLPNLTTFSHGVEIIECPQLTKVEIVNCPKLKTKIGKCPNLRDIRLWTFNGVDHLLSSCITRKWNAQLQAIEIYDCDTIEEILWDEGNRHVILPELYNLELSKLPCLTTFYRGVESIKFPNLETLTIGNLPRMNSFAPMDSEPTHDDHSLHFFCNQKVEFPSLRTLHLRGLHDIRSKIWCNNMPINFFRNLCFLSISFVDGIRNLMSSSIAINLVNLSVLTIGSCPNVVEVIEDENEVPVASLFPKLRNLGFISLHKLRSFCQRKHALELPLLENVHIH